MRYTLLIASLFALICSACVQKEKPASRGQALHWGMLGEPESIDPALISGDAGADIAWQIYEGLTTSDPKTLKTNPGVATHWKVSSDGKIYTFYLRKEAKFSDGTPIRASDFYYSWLRALNPATASRYAFILYPIKGAEKYNTGKTKLAKSVGIKVVDEHTLEVVLENPTPYFPQLTAFYTYMPVKKGVVEKFGDKWVRSENIVGNGPFILNNWEPQRAIELIPNPHYWDSSKVKLKKVIFHPNEDRISQLKRYQSGEIDYLRRVPAVLLPSLTNEPGLHHSVQLATYEYIINTRHPVLKDKRVRQALSLAIDRKSLVKILNSHDTPAEHLTPNVFSDYKGPKKIKFDPKEAKQKLAQAGFENMKDFPEITLLYNTSENHKLIAEIIQQMWKKHLGIKVAILNQEWKVYIKSMNAYQFDVVRMTWGGDYYDPNTFLDMYASWSHQNHARWHNKEFDALIQKASQTVDVSKRMSFLYKAEELLLEELPVLPLFYHTYPILINPRVKGLYPNAQLRHPLKEVYIEEVVAKN